MSGVGINLGVDFRQVREARKESDLLNKSLKETQTFDNLAPGNEGLSEMSALLKEISEDVMRLKGLSKSGEAQGGIFKKEQFKEYDTLTSRIGENFGKHTKEIIKARVELTKLIDEKKKLAAVDSSKAPESPAAYTARQERLSSIDAEIETKRKSLSQKEKLEARARELDVRAQGYGERIEKFGEASDSSGGSILNTGVTALKKTLGWAAAIAGGVSMIGLIRNSMEKSAVYDLHEGSLGMRGAKDLRKATLGYTPTEGASIAEAILKQTSYRDDDENNPNQLSRATETAKTFSRATGQLSAEPTVAFMGDLYKKTGADDAKQTRVLESIFGYLTKSKRVGQTEEILRDINRAVNAVYSTQGGKELSEKQLNTALSVQEAMYNMPGFKASAPDLFEKVQRGFARGGTTVGGKTLMWKAIGGFDKVPGGMTPERLQDLQIKMEQGLSNPETLARFKKEMERMFPNPAIRAAAIRNELPELNATQAKAIEKMLFTKNPLQENFIKQFGGDPESDAMDTAATAAKEFLKTKAGDNLKTEANVELAKITPGEVFKGATNTFKNAVADFSKAATAQSLKDNDRNILDQRLTRARQRGDKKTEKEVIKQIEKNKTKGVGQHFYERIFEKPKSVLEDDPIYKIDPTTKKKEGAPTQVQEKDSAHTEAMHETLKNIEKKLPRKVIVTVPGARVEHAQH